MLYARMGYRAPFVFALCLRKPFSFKAFLFPLTPRLAAVFVDFALRLLVIEKHMAIKWIEAGHEIPGFEAPNYQPQSFKRSPTGETIATPLGNPMSTPAENVKTVDEAPGELPSKWVALLSMMTSPRPVSNFLLTVLNGIVMGGTIGKDRRFSWSPAVTELEFRLQIPE